MTNDLFYQIALSITPEIGVVRARALLDHFENAENIFKASTKDLFAVANIGSIAAQSVKSFRNFSSVEEEIAFIEKYKIKPVFISDEKYPKRLWNCYDPPIMLYYKGEADLSPKRIISIVGTRSYTNYGREITEKTIAALADQNITIVSGLAVGIDIIAHKAALEYNIPTIGVMGSGLKTIYPPAHKKIAAEMAEKGGLLTEFTHKVIPDRHNFPRRNRIVAGMCDAVIVMETSLKGGSMITAEIANSYSKDVFAVPGRLTDTKSAGCNYLIHSNKALLFDSAEDFLHMMDWNEGTHTKKNKIQDELFYKLSAEERRVADFLQEKEIAHIDEITSFCGYTSTKLASLMLQLELQNIIRTLPGKMYSLY